VLVWYFILSQTVGQGASILAYLKGSLDLVLSGQGGIFNRSVLAIGHNLMLFCPKGLYLVEEMKKVLYVTLSGQGAYLQEILVCVKGALLCKSLICVR
jgi:hypothetical protein